VSAARAGDARHRGGLAAALAALGGWLLEPVEGRPERSATAQEAAERAPAGFALPSIRPPDGQWRPGRQPPANGRRHGSSSHPATLPDEHPTSRVEERPPPLAPSLRRPLVAVVALAARTGATTVARALAAELAVRDPGGAAAVASLGEGPPRSPGAASLLLAGPPTAAARRLAWALRASLGAPARAAGRLALVSTSEPAALRGAGSHLAPVVIDVPAGEASESVAFEADHVLLVASPKVEPALAVVAAAALGRLGSEPTLVLNRVPDPGEWLEHPAHRLPESRAGARVALAGRESRRGLGPAVAALADRCEVARCG
jgi:hypothetical protein